MFCDWSVVPWTIDISLAIKTPSIVALLGKTQTFLNGGFFGTFGLVYHFVFFSFFLSACLLFSSLVCISAPLILICIWQRRQKKDRKGDTVSPDPICTYLTNKTKQKEKRGHFFCFTCAHFCLDHSYLYIFNKKDKTKREKATLFLLTCTHFCPRHFYLDIFDKRDKTKIHCFMFHMRAFLPGSFFFLHIWQTRQDKTKRLHCFTCAHFCPTSDCYHNKYVPTNWKYLKSGW